MTQDKEKVQKWFVSYEWNVKDYFLRVIPFGRIKGIGHSELEFESKVFTVNQLVRALIKEYEEMGAKNPSFTILNFRRLQ